MRESARFFGLLDGIVGAGDGGDIGAAGELAAGGFRAESFHGFGGRADEDEAGVGAGARQSGVFGEETVAGMNGVAAGAARDVHDFVDAEIAFAGGGRADGVGFVGEAHVEGFAVHVAEYGCGADAEFAAGAQDADGDLAAIGDQDFLEHAVLAMRGNSSMRGAGTAGERRSLRV